MSSIHALRLRLVSGRIKSTGILLGSSVLLLCFLVQGVFFVRANSPTYDEAMHLAAGYSYLATRDFRLEPQNPPLLKEWLALPVFLFYRLSFAPNADDWREGTEFLVGQKFLYHSAIPGDRLLLAARLANLILAGCLIALLSWWAYRLWGAGAALLAAALACFEPNLVAHGGLVTTDIGAALFTVLTIYLLWEEQNSPRPSLLAAAGVSLGSALASKFSTVVLIPIIAALLALALFRSGRAMIFFRTRLDRLSVRCLDTALGFLLVLLCAAPVIVAAYCFHGIRPWFFGLNRFFELARVGQPAFFLGEYAYQGWWNYYLLAFLIKTPLGSLLLIALSLLLYRHGWRLEAPTATFLLLPIMIILLATAQARVNIGLRHILPVYPLLFVLASRLATVRFNDVWVAPALIAAGLCLTMISSLKVAPHQLAYFNEIAGGPGEGYRSLADSNVDWGQDLKTLKAYVDKEKLPIIYLSYFGSAPPSHYGIRYQYVPGTWPLEWPPPADAVPPMAQRKILAVSVNNLLDIFNPSSPLFRWLQYRDPIAKIGYSIFVYDLTDDPVALMMLERTYALAGLRPPSNQSSASN